MSMIKNSFDVQLEKYILWLIAAAVVIKLSLFIHIACVDPSPIREADSFGYLNDAKALVHHFTTPSEIFKPGLYRTPGYPFFLAIFHFVYNLPLLSIIFLQFILNILTALVVFKTVSLSDRQTGLLSAAIVLLDLPTTIYSSMILTESLYVFVLSLFLYAFVRYINGRHLKWLVLAAFLLGASVYIRPVGYFLGIATAGFILYLWGIKKILTGVAHAAVALMLVYGLLVIWQYHNLKVYSEFTFSSISEATIQPYGVIGRYSRETDPKLKAMPPVLYYADSVGRNFLSLMATPGSMKYFHSKGWRIFGIIFGYVFVVFWWIGLVIGIRQCKADTTGQFLFLVLLYFISISIVATGWGVTNRFRVPMVPSIAVLSALGWMKLKVKFLKH